MQHDATLFTKGLYSYVLRNLIEWTCVIFCWRCEFSEMADADILQLDIWKGDWGLPSVDIDCLQVLVCKGYDTHMY